MIDFFLPSPLIKKPEPNMRKLTAFAMALVAFVVTLSSCSTVNKSKTFTYDYMYITKQGIIQRPLITDLEVAKEKQRITKTYTNVTVQEAKENAMGDFIQQFNCDLIVQPYYVTETEASTTRSTVTVNMTGYPANYKNIRMFELKDTASFKIRTYVNNDENAPLMSQPPMVEKKKSSAGKVLGTVLGIGLLLALLGAASGGN
jgi:hypothetical protein